MKTKINSFKDLKTKIEIKCLNFEADIFDASTRSQLQYSIINSGFKASYLKLFLFLFSIQ